MNTSHPKLLRAILISFALIVVFVIGNYTGGKSVVQGASPVISGSNTSLLNQVGLTEQELIPFLRAWKVLNEKYVDRASTTESIGDPYTVFFDPEETKTFESDIKGNFEGVGMEIGLKEDFLTVVAPLKNSPAEKAGVQTGDRILKIDDQDATGMAVDKAVKLIRGKKGTSVKILFLKVGTNTPQEITITRDVIDMPTVETSVKQSTLGSNIKVKSNGLVEGDIFVMRLYGFTENSTELFRNALREFIKSGSHKLILDLRGNPGGYLNAAWDMASYFLPAGEVVVVEDFGENMEKKYYRSKGYNAFPKGDLKMIILVDKGSASASEILAGALKEHGIAKLVGTKTFGKGSVQELVAITPETALKVTVARWLTPHGINLSKEGLTPDEIVEIKPEDVKAKNDVQMQKAIQMLKNEK